MNIPGITAKHAIITDECRVNKGDKAFEEAVNRLFEEYQAALPHHPIGNATRFHLVLSVEYEGIKGND